MKEKNRLCKRFRSLEPYHSAHLTKGVILNANESPYDVPQELKDYMKTHIDQLFINRYPDTDSLELVKAISMCYQVKPENVTCSVGSDELIHCILTSVLEEDDKVLIPYPSFSMYTQYTILNKGSVIQVPLNSNFGYDVLAIKSKIEEEQPKVSFICNPNNPTGCIMSREEIQSILEIAEGLVVIDEAYEDFTQKPISMIPYIQQYDNLIVLRTFSKAYALAGTRVGYAIASEPLIKLINTVKSPYNLNSFSQCIATWAIQHKAYFKANALKIISQKDYVDQEIKALGFITYPSEANFIWTELPDVFYKQLIEREIYIRKIRVNDKNYYRITIGTPEENEIFLNILKELRQ